MFLYVIVSTIISFISLLDSINVDDFHQISNLEWFKLVFKSFLPSLISVKAFLDTSVSDVNKNIEEQNP